MNEPTFAPQQTGGTLYILSSTMPLSTYQVAFLPDSISPPPTISLTDSWTTDTGLYLFLNQILVDEATFLADLDRYLPKNSTIRFLWIANPNDLPSQWETQQIIVDKDAVTYPAQLTFRNYTAIIGRACTLTLVNTEDVWGFAISKTVNQTINLTVSQTPFEIEGSTATLPFSGPALGCIQFELSAADNEALTTLDVGCRSFFNDTTMPGYGYLQSFRYPIFDLNRPISLYTTLDPLNPLNGDRTHFSFLVEGSGGDIPLDSFYRTTTGETIQLLPTQPDSHQVAPRLVFTSRTLTQQPNGTDPFYLAPEGVFTAVGPDNDLKIMAGIAAGEYFEPATVSNTLLTFYPGHDAYAPNFLPLNPILDKIPIANIGRAANIALGFFSTEAIAAKIPAPNIAQTSWTYLSHSGQNQLVAYIAQAEQGRFYQPDLQNEGFMTPLLTETAVLTNASPTPFPLMPYAGLQLEEDGRHEAYENKVLSPRRRDILWQTIPPELLPKEEEESLTQGSSSTQGLTSQGFLLELGSTGDWKKLVVANTGGELVRFKNMNRSPIQAALQSDQTFMVTTNKDLMNRYGPASGFDTVTLESWNFLLSPSKWDNHGTIMIFKFSDRSLAALTADVNAWQWPEAAQSEQRTLRGTQDELLTIIGQAESRRKTNPLYAAFLDDIVHNPDWNGVLFLRCAIDVDNLPQELRSLKTGLNLDYFFGHHLGFEVTPVTNSGGQLSIDQTAVFALVAYEDPQDLVFDDIDYQFKVLNLFTQFRGSTIHTFNSQIELMVNRLFGERAVLHPSERGNNLILNGVLQRKNGVNSYAFSRSKNNTFRLASHVVEEINITKAKFETRSTSSSKTETRFLLTGDLHFIEFPQFDLFSFGQTESSTESKLRFKNLAIHMDFNPSKPANQNFRFDASDLSFDVAHSLARPDSLYQHFPLRLNGFRQGDVDSSPGDSGYISTVSPLVQGDLTSDTAPWYGLTFQLDLGKLGDLAGTAGLSATLFAGWGPSIDEANVYVGIKLPGSRSANAEIPIQNVLKLAFDKLEFLVDDTGDRPGYMLKFKGIALSLMGVSFPPGQTDIMLFGNPNDQSNTTLGWYAAFTKE